MIERTDGALRVSAPMVIANARTLLEAGRALLIAGPSANSELLELAAVQEVDSSALSVVFAWLRVAAQRGVTLRIAHPPASLLSLATLYGVSELLPLA